MTDESSDKKTQPAITELDLLTWLRRDCDYLLGVADALQNPSVRNRVCGMISTLNKRREQLGIK